MSTDTIMLNGLDIRADMSIPQSYFERVEGPDFLNGSPTVQEPSWENAYELSDAERVRREVHRNAPRNHKPARTAQPRTRTAPEAARQQADTAVRETPQPRTRTAPEAARQQADTAVQETAQPRTRTAPEAARQPADTAVQETAQPRTRTAPEAAVQQTPLPVGMRRRGREANLAHDTGIFGRLRPPAVRTHQADAETPNRPAQGRIGNRNPTRRPSSVIPRGFFEMVLRTLLILGGLGFALYGIINNWQTVKDMAMEYAVSWIILFIVLTYSSRRYLQVNQIAGATTILSIIAVLLLNNVFGLGTAVTGTVTGVLMCAFNTLIPLALLVYLLFMAVRSLFR